MKSFDEWWEENYMMVSADKTEAENIYNLGQQSKQAEVDELRKRLTMYEREGYKLVPVEPTQEMISAGMGVFSFPLDNGRFSDCELIFSYREMIGACDAE